MQFFKYALAAFSIGSAIAAPAFPVASNAVTTVTSVANVQVLVSTVTSVKSKVEQQLSSISKLLPSDLQCANIR